MADSVSENEPWVAQPAAARGLARELHARQVEQLHGVPPGQEGVAAGWQVWTEGESSEPSDCSDDAGAETEDDY